MIDVVFLVLPDTLLLDLAGPAEAFRLANQALRRRGRALAFRMRHIGPRPQTASSVGLMLGGLEPLPAGFDPAQPTWLVLLGRPGEVDEVVGATPDCWRAGRRWAGAAAVREACSCAGVKPVPVSCTVMRSGTRPLSPPGWDVRRSSTAPDVVLRRASDSRLTRSC